ncbi:hypothetical protein [Arthrobacter nitrophenolicus]|uniref:hypothetical protein n=1 Tax=Arthrobacter nitrophenolicus TaxID=683150 RepID=UPI00197A96A1|nr:hypothetical protein [Arthrobacter nitrophenolicus]
MDRRLLFECVVTSWAAAKAASAQLDELEWLTEMADAVTGSTATGGCALYAGKVGRHAGGHHRHCHRRHRQRHQLEGSWSAHLPGARRQHYVMTRGVLLFSYRIDAHAAPQTVEEESAV